MKSISTADSHFVFFFFRVTQTEAWLRFLMGILSWDVYKLTLPHQSSTTSIAGDWPGNSCFLFLGDVIQLICVPDQLKVNL